MFMTTNMHGEKVYINKDVEAALLSYVDYMKWSSGPCLGKKRRKKKIYLLQTECLEIAGLAS